MDVAMELFRGYAQRIEVTKVVRFGEETGLTIVFPLYDLLG
jgi:hypothetical protein